MKTPPARHVLPLLAIALLGSFAQPAAAGRPSRVPVSCLAITVDGQEITGPPADPEAAAVYTHLVRLLRRQGFRVLSSADPEKLLGARTVGLTGLARLEVETAAKPFVFNVALLPPRWARTKTGSAIVRPARGGDPLWSRKLSIPLDTPPQHRRKRTIDRLYVELATLRPSAAVAPDPALALTAVLAINDVATTPESFADAARRLARNEAFRDASALLAIALDRRAAADPDLRPELLQRAVAMATPPFVAELGAALARALGPPALDPALADGLGHALKLLGVPPGDALAPGLRRADLPTLLAVRSRFEFRKEAPWLNSRIEQLAVEAVDRTPDFLRAEEVVRGLPVDELGDETRRLLRSALSARAPEEPREAYRARIATLVPGDLPGSADSAAEADLEADRRALGEARSLARAPEHVRLTFFRSYLRCSALGGASDRIARLLGLEEALERELARALAGSRDAVSEAAAIRAVFGSRPGEVARESLGRALVAALGPAPSDDDLRTLHERHPELDGVTALVRDAGIVRAPETHTFAVRLGDPLDHTLRTLGPAARRVEGLTRRDLSPAAFVSAATPLKGPSRSGFETVEGSGARALLRDGSTFRLVLEETGKRFHHGIRPGDRRGETIAVRGEPDRTRALLFGREVLTWSGLHDGTAELHAVLDHDVVSFLYEEDVERTRDAVATAR